MAPVMELKRQYESQLEQPTPTITIPVEDTNVPQGAADFNAVGAGAVAGAVVGGLIGAIRPTVGIDLSKLPDERIPEGEHDEFHTLYKDNFKMIVHPVDYEKRSRLLQIFRDAVSGGFAGVIAGIAWGNRVEK